MEDKEIEEIISRKKEPTNKELFKLATALV